MQLTESICLRAALLVIGMAVIGGGPEVSAQNENVCTRTIQVWRAIEAVSGEGCARLTLHHLREITTLDLRNQSISSLSASDFDGLVRLETLDLSGNVLTSLPSGVFDELYLLKTLRLNGNLLQTLPDGIFDSLLLLKELTLHENRFTSLPDGLFEELSLFDGMQADGSQPDNSGPYPRIQRFLDRHAVSSPEEFIAALPTSYLQRFVLMYRSESPAAPRLREQADPPSTADRLPPRRGDRPSSKTYFAAGRALVALTGALALPATAEAQDPPGQPDLPIEAIFWVSSEVVVYPETDTGPRDRAVATTPRRMAVSQRLGVDAMSRPVVCIALVVATLTACVQTQDEHSPAAQALAALRASAEAGAAEAQFILGGMYVTGVGVPQDAAEAVAWYRRAAEQGYARAQYNLGVIYAEGVGGPQNAAEAVAWYRRAAEQGNARAQSNLGAMYDQGVGVPQDAAEAVAWYRRAAEQGDASAQSNLGAMYDQGVGVPQDAAEAVAWYRRAAEQGDARAQYNLGGMYREGVGVPQDAAGAVAWYRRAAEQGHARAQYNLGGMYDQGLAVPQDAAEAHMWLTIAASRSTGAERELIVTARAAVAARMTPTDLREAERRAQAWHAAHQGMRNRAAPPSDTGREGLIIALGLLVAL